MLKIRNATLKDLNRLKEIEDAAFGRQKINENRFTIKTRLVAFPRGIFVAESGGKVVGYTASELRGRITRFALDYDARTRHSPKGPYMYIATLAVDPKFHGQGTGRILLRKQLVLAKKLKLKAVVLSTWYARKYYPRFGFKVYRTIYLKNGEINYHIFIREVG